MERNRDVLLLLDPQGVPDEHTGSHCVGGVATLARFTIFVLVKLTPQRLHCDNCED